MNRTDNELSALRVARLNDVLNGFHPTDDEGIDYKLWLGVEE